MQHISFEALFNKAMKLKQAGIKWHFHMIGPACIFSRSKEQYEIIIENETTDYMQFTSKKWYRIRVRVTDERIEAWIDDEQKVDQKVAGHTFDTRVEVDLSKPLGIACYDTRAALRDIQIRTLSP